MNAEAIAVVRAQALAQWGPERRDAAALELVSGLGGMGAAETARPHAGRSVNVPLSSLLSPAARLPASPSAPAPDDVLPDLAQRATLAARNGFALTAVVLDTLPDGRYKVAVADAQVALDLPEGLQPGELVLLRPKAGADFPPQPAAQTAAQPAAAPLAGNAFEMDLGTTAQLLSRLASAIPASDASPAPIVTKAPLASEPGNARQVATGLRDAIATSGLFYESHLADWVDGSAGPQALAREPQAALAQAVAGSQDPGSPHALAPQAESLVQRQLDVLEHRTALWQGQAWPGQPAEVRIAEDEDAKRAQPDGQPRAWQASLRLTMPGLGPLEAHVSLTGRQARLAVTAADPASAGRIAGARGDLARALKEQGVTLAEAKVDHGTPSRPR